jgi:hypothetical protein
MKRWRYVSIISMVVTAGLLGAGALVVGQSRVPSEAIASSVTRTPELMERAWHLPVAATFHRHVNWQSNASRCGPAAVANAYRSLGEAASTEGKVLAGTGRCWTGVCILGLTLDELAEVARTNTRRKVTVLRDLSEDQFLEHLRRSNDPGRRYIVNFDRTNLWCWCRTSFAHWWLSRSRGPGFRARCQFRLPAMASRAKAAVRGCKYVRRR